MAAVHRREGRERRSTAFQKKIDPQHALSSSCLWSEMRSCTWAEGSKTADGDHHQLSQTFFQKPFMFVGVAGSNCRMYTKVVLHKQTSLRYRIQRLFRQPRGSAGRSRQNRSRDRWTTPEKVGLHANDGRSSSSPITSGLFMCTTRPPEPHLAPRTTPDSQNQTWLPEPHLTSSATPIWIRFCSIKTKSLSKESPAGTLDVWLQDNNLNFFLNSNHLNWQI